MKQILLLAQMPLDRASSIQLILDEMAKQIKTTEEIKYLINSLSDNTLTIFAVAIQELRTYSTIPNSTLQYDEWGVARQVLFNDATEKGSDTQAGFISALIRECYNVILHCPLARSITCTFER